MLPVIDITPLYLENIALRRNIGHALLDAYRAFGFCYITGARVPSLQNGFSNARAFFAQDVAAKNALSIHTSPRLQGYEPQTTQESKEAFVIGREPKTGDPVTLAQTPYHGPNRFPSAPETFKPIAIGLFDEMLDLARLLNRALALSIGVDEHHFDVLSDKPLGALRFLHYPPATGNDTRDGIGAHTDWGALSILAMDDVPGLDIQTALGEWMPVPPRADALVINIGNLVERWTNGDLKATLHRVQNRTARDRYSIAFFLDMNHDALIEPLAPFVSESNPSRFAPVTVSDYLQSMHEQDYGSAT